MRSFDLQAVRRARFSYIISASTLVTLFVIFHLNYFVVENDIVNAVASTPSFFPERLELSLNPTPPVELVVASTSQQNTSWYSKFFPDWGSNIFTVDDQFSPLKIPRNKGHEAMVYLTYIIDRYESLPENILFLHAERFQWHNDNPNYDGVLLLRNFQFPYLQQEGYVNLRCVWTLGCPAAIHPLKDELVEGKVNKQAMGAVFRQAFQELLPEHQVPPDVGVSCCAQFAVTRDTIRRRPRDDYLRFREWLIKTPFPDELSGRFFEHSWHIIFGKEPVHCPSAQDCYCKLYGMCNLQDCTVRGCNSYYVLPPYSTLPKDWPRIGWEGEERPYNDIAPP
ncbi:hypothetical protein BGW36DRAFT_386836 [Talaromyces proteolyticus]|uniref:Uncharacterized protein n=1 Tax=Talaromyces proteolyticus TaxID=1131652 RepID=A0AAD4PWH8_9EURO|nr:uncharacterized protein BGW36DRAFT_386836 [Talaromyces proteolyticus]KAH8692022.1 hypothetical protein BGW36DRAFT_386836 [Talaromyces proteolyticus]